MEPNNKNKSLQPRGLIALRWRFNYLLSKLEKSHCFIDPDDIRCIRLLLSRMNGPDIMYATTCLDNIQIFANTMFGMYTMNATHRPHKTHKTKIWTYEEILDANREIRLAKKVYR